MSVTSEPETGAGAQDEELGRIDAIVIAWPPDAPKTGEAAPLLMDLVERGIVRIIDMMFVSKGEDGSVVGFEAKDLSDKGVGAFEIFEGASAGLLNDADVAEAAEAIDPEWTAAVIIYENRWSAPLAAAVRRNGGLLLDAQSIRPAELIEALDAAEAAS